MPLIHQGKGKLQCLISKFGRYFYFLPTLKRIPANLILPTYLELNVSPPFKQQVYLPLISKVDIVSYSLVDSHLYQNVSASCLNVAPGSRKEVCFQMSQNGQNVQCFCELVKHCQLPFSILPCLFLWDRLLFSKYPTRKNQLIFFSPQSVDSSFIAGGMRWGKKPF